MQKMQRRLQETMDHLRGDIGKVDEPQLKAMFETAAAVLGGLKKAFCDSMICAAVTSLRLPPLLRPASLLAWADSSCRQMPSMPNIAPPAGLVLSTELGVAVKAGGRAADDLRDLDRAGCVRADLRTIRRSY
jgi:hypothetical protein